MKAGLAGRAGCGSLVWHMSVMHTEWMSKKALLSGASVPADTGIVHHAGREFAENEPR
jgi:hypothetical protein